jgi:hypothetical protein
MLEFWSLVHLFYRAGRACRICPRQPLRVAIVEGAPDCFPLFCSVALIAELCSVCDRVLGRLSAIHSSKLISTTTLNSSPAAQRGRGCHIAIRPKKTARCCGATGPQPVKVVRSNPNARRGRSGGLHGGSTSICSKLCSSASTQTQRPSVASGFSEFIVEDQWCAHLSSVSGLSSFGVRAITRSRSGTPSVAK